MPAPDVKPRRPIEARTIMVASLVGAVLAGALFSVASEFFEFDKDLAYSMLLAAAGVVGIVMTFFYWPRLDEAAREAHKFAWLWGGSAALFLMVLALPFLLATGATVPPLFFERDDAAGVAANAILATFMAQVVGYGIAWALWWLKRR